MVRAKLVKIGNSRGIRLAKPLLEVAGLADEVEIEAAPGILTISPSAHPRAESVRRLLSPGDAGIEMPKKFPPLPGTRAMCILSKLLNSIAMAAFDLYYAYSNIFKKPLDNLF